MAHVKMWKASLAVVLVGSAAIAGCYVELNLNLDDDEPAVAEPAVEAPAVKVPAATPDVSERPLPPAPPRIEVVLEPEAVVIREAVLPPPPLPPEPVPPEPAAAEKDVEAEPTFTPFTVAPSIENRSEVLQAMVRNYPPLLRDAGIGGTARIYFLIGDDGETLQIRLDQGSGNKALDQAALTVAEVYRFTPAMNRGDRVPVWVSFPITFQVR
jgi:periplasmic protein TonB